MTQDISTLMRQMHCIVVGVDPAVSSHDRSCETGIVVAGKDISGTYYVLDDQSGRYSMMDWASKVVETYDRWMADCVIAEVNQGGELVQDMIQVCGEGVCFKAVRASRGKFVRAEPIAALYQQKKVLHLEPFKTLESQMLSFTQGGARGSDRVDALVWALTELVGRQSRPAYRVHTVA